MDNQDIMRIAIEQSAIDMNCLVEDLTRQDNTVVISELNIGAKRCYKEKLFCGLIFYGDGLVASVDKSIKPFMEEFIKKHQGFRCFDTPQLIVLNQELEKYGKCVCFLAEFFMPDLKYNVSVNQEIEIKIIEGEDISILYHDDRFHMALGYDNKSDKRDVLAVVGYIDGEIAGIAGASNDCDTMWQIGIDVLPEYRRKRVAGTLTKIITDEIIKRGKVPYYCTAWSNIASKRNAINCGYKTAWVEMAAIDKYKAMQMIGE